MIYYLLSFFVKLFSFIPFWILYFISDCLYYPVYYIFRYRRPIVRKNLTDSFPEKNQQEIIVIERTFYRFFIDFILESCKLATMSVDSMKRHMKFQNAEVVNAFLREGTSVALYLGHYANWEWCSSIPLHMDDDAVSAQIYHKLSNKYTDKLMLYIRERMGATCVDMHKTARYVTEQVRERRTCIIGFIADQSPRKRDAQCFLPFLNHNTPVLIGTEKLIKHYGFQAFFVRVRRVKRGYYVSEFVQLHEHPQALPDFELTAIYFHMLEQCIRECPELYLWSHKRFRRAKKIDV